MKNVFLLLIGFLLVTSCNKKEEETNTSKITNNSLVGSWKVINVYSEKGKLSGKTKLNGINVPIDSDVKMTGKNYDMIVTFTETPKEISSKGGFTAVIEVTLPFMGKKSFEQQISEIPDTSGNWSVTNNFLNTTNNGKTTSIEIVSFNNSEIVFSIPLSSGFNNPVSSLNLKEVKVEGNLFIKAVKQ